MNLDRPCFQHPDRDATAYCEKYSRYLCDECTHCRQPENHCKHRTACLIWEFEKHGRPEESPVEQANAGKSVKSGG